MYVYVLCDCVDEEETQEAFRKHFEHQIKLYSNVVSVQAGLAVCLWPCYILLDRADFLFVCDTGYHQSHQPIWKRICEWSLSIYCADILTSTHELPPPPHTHTHGRY